MTTKILIPDEVLPPETRPARKTRVWTWDDEPSSDVKDIPPKSDAAVHPMTLPIVGLTVAAAKRQGLSPEAQVVAGITAGVLSEIIFSLTRK